MNERSSFSPCSTLSSRRRSSSAGLLLAASWCAVLVLAGCGSSSSPSEPGVTPPPTPTPTPAPSPTPSQPAACRLTAPTVNCDTHSPTPLELAPVLQSALDVAISTPGAMYTEYPNRIYDLTLFRSRTIDHLTAAGVCGAWDYSNETGDEIYVRSADGCVVEQYDVLSGDGGVRGASKSSLAWTTDWGPAVPAPRPQYPKQGDLACSLPGDRSSYSFSLRGGPGQFGSDMYRFVVEVMNENPQLFDKSDYVPGQGDFIPDQLRVAAWRILDPKGFIAAVESKLRSRGYCGYVDGDILRAKNVARGNVFHEEFDIIQNPANGGSYVSFVVKDRCHNAGF